MKFKQYLQAISDNHGFFPTNHLKWTVQKNPRPTAREEAIAAQILEQANPRENISAHAGWDKEETLVLQQLWLNPTSHETQWRDVPNQDLEDLYSTKNTKYGPMPVPNAISQPETVKADFTDKIREALGE